MAEGWKQVWEDIINSMRGKAPRTEKEIPAEDDHRSETEVTEANEVPEQIADVSTPSAQTKDPAPPLAPATPAFIPTPGAADVEGIPTSSELSQADGLVDPVTILVTEAATPPVELSEKRPSRRWILALGVVLVVVFYFLSDGQWLRALTEPKPPSADLIATFDGGQITITDVEEHFKQLVPEELSVIANSPEAFVATVEHLVIEELVQRWAAERQPDADENFRHTMQHINEDLNLESFEIQLHESGIPISESEIQSYYNTNQASFGDQPLSAVREQIRQILISEQEASFVEEYIQRLKENASITRDFDLLEVPPPSDDDLLRYYETNRSRFSLPKQVIVDELAFPIGEDEVAARQDADDALLKIRAGTPFVEVNQVIPRTVTSTFILVSEGTRDPAWETVVFELTESEISSVFRAGDIFYIVRLQELQPPRTQTLDEVRAQVESIVAQQKTDEWFEANASKTLFTLKGRQYTLGQFYQEYQELPPAVQAQFAGPAGMEQLSELLVERLLLVEDTYDQLLDVENQPLVDEARLLVLQQMLHQEEVDDKIEINDEAIQAFYEENAALMAMPPQVRLRYIRIGLGNSEDEAEAARARADEVYKMLNPGLFQRGEDFATVAQDFSEDPETAANGGELPGWVGETNDILTELELHPFHEMAIALQPEEISRPFEFGGSVYIIQVIERGEAQQLPFEMAKPLIEEYLWQQQHDEILANLQNNLLNEANFTLYPSILDDYISQMLNSESSTPISSDN